MKHIRYVDDTKTTVCQHPEKLDDWVPVAPDVGKTPHEENCKECSYLLLAHNKREFEKEGKRNFGLSLIVNPPPRRLEEGPVAPLAIFATGFVSATVFWMILWLIVFQGIWRA